MILRKTSIYISASLIFKKINVLETTQQKNSRIIKTTSFSPWNWKQLERALCPSKLHMQGLISHNTCHPTCSSHFTGTLIQRSLKEMQPHSYTPP
jgi:hypothetical protein